MYRQTTLLVLVLATLLAVHGENYGSKFDKIDVDDLLKNERLLNNYVKCLKNAGPCTPDGQDLKG
jgi:hypothetical protein